MPRSSFLDPRSILDPDFQQETQHVQRQTLGRRFSQPTDKFVEEFTASIDFDKRLYRQDIRGSIAHARMLGKQGIIPLADVEAIVAGLQEILAQIEAGNFDFSVSLEDIHMNIEARLSAAIGEAGKRSTPAAPATTRWRSTSVSTCGTRSARSAPTSTC